MLKGKEVSCLDDTETLSERKRSILLNSVADYIQSAVPITSKMVKEQHMVDISTATLRNELNALEAMGYLKQLHTSSGRVPTSKAYRVYVDSLMKDLTFKGEELDIVKKGFNLKAQNLGSLIDKVAKTISKVTDLPTVVVMNDLKMLIIEDIKIIPLIDYSALMLIQTSSGIINNTFEIDEDTTEDDCIESAKVLRQSFTGHTIEYMIENIESVAKNYNKRIYVFKKIFDSIIELLSSSKTTARAGGTKLLNMPEYSDIEKAQRLLTLMEDNEALREVVRADDTLTFKIGKENENETLKDCTVVTAPLSFGDETIASVGVIGPERIDYELVAGSLQFVVNELKNIKRLKGDVDEEKT